MNKYAQQFEQWKNKWVFWLILGAAVLFMIATVLRLLTPKTPPLPTGSSVSTNFNGTKTVFKDLRFTGEKPGVPRNFQVLTLQNVDAKTRLKTQLIDAFGLAQSSLDPTILTGPDYYLSTTDDQEWVLAKNASTPPGATINLATAKDVARQFFTTYFPGLGLEAYDEGISYFHGDEVHIEEESPTKANVVTIPFTFVVEGFPVYQTNHFTPPFVLTVNNTEVSKVVFNPAVFMLGAPLGSIPSLSVDQAVANLNQSQGAVISSTQDTFGPTALEQITSGTLTEVVIEYRTDPDVGRSYPFYRFTGTVVNAQGVEMSVQIITPAVATTSQ